MSIKLTLKQKRFADEYIISGNATQSAIKAGYSKNYSNTNVSKLLQNTTIKSYIQERMKELEDSAIAKQDEVLKYLTSVLRGESKSTIVVVEGTGEGCSEARIIQKPPDEKERLKSAELLGKRYGIFTDTTELDKLKAEKLKTEINILKNVETVEDDDGFIDAIKSTAKEVWNDGEDK